MKRQASGLFVALLCATVSPLNAQSMDTQMPVVAASVSKTLASQGFKNLAAVDFTDLQGRTTELGRFLAERFAVELIAAGGISLLDRANIKNILAEHKLTEEGLVNPANAKKLGQFAGVDVILIGNITSLDSRIEVLVKAISTESAKIVAAGRMSFAKTSDLDQLLNRGLSASLSGTNSSPSAAGNTSPGTTVEEANALATRDVGALRIVLKSVLPVKLKDRASRDQNGIRCSFELINRETQRELLIAVNAENLSPYFDAIPLLRSTLSDEAGGVWELPRASVKGMGVVTVGANRYGNYNPTDVIMLLKQQDQLHTDRLEGAFSPFIYGGTSTIAPGQSARVTMEFAQRAGQNGPVGTERFFQLDAEIIVGVVSADGKRSYSLQNLTFDRISMPRF